LSFRTMVQQEPLKMVSDVRKQKTDTLFTLLGVGMNALMLHFRGSYVSSMIKRAYVACTIKWKNALHVI
jgi:hypothetical protein